ncbi:MAG TPA: hypothetical protein VGG61_02880 [Gemmataceae bacterium]
MTRKTQIGLLMTASVLCCAGVFIGARLSNGSHASMMDGQKPSVAEATPPSPTPVPETPKSEPTIITKIDLPLSQPPDLSPLPPVDQAGAKPMPEDLPPLPPPGSKSAGTDLSPTAAAESPVTKASPPPEITLVRADQPAPDNKPTGNPSTNPQPMPDLEALPPKHGDASPPQPAVKDETDPLTPVNQAPESRAPSATKELTGKIPPIPPAPTSQEPLPSSPAPSDNLPPPSAPDFGPSSPDAVSRIKIGSKSVDALPPPRVTTPDEPPQPSAETGPPARIVPVSPTTPATTTGVVTPVLKKPSTVAKAKVLPLTGTHGCKLDEKNGLTLPKAVREQMGEQETLFVTLGSDHCVWLTTAAGLEKLTDRLEKSPAVEDEAKVARRRYFAQTERIAVDKNGYFMIPAALLESVGLKQDAVLIGVGDHFELWDVQRWHKYSQTPGAELQTGTPDSHVEY